MSEIEKARAVYGIEGLSIFPVITNTDAAYAVGQRILVPEVQVESITNPGTTQTIYADNRPYIVLRPPRSLNIEFTLAEMDLKIIAALTGSTYDEVTGTLKVGDNDASPTLAFSVAYSLAGGGYRLKRYFAAEVTSVAPNSVNTRGDNLAISPYTLGLATKSRKVDNQAEEWTDVDDISGLSWLEVIPPVTK